MKIGDRCFLRGKHNINCYGTIVGDIDKDNIAVRLDDFQTVYIDKQDLIVLNSGDKTDDTL